MPFTVTIPAEKRRPQDEVVALLSAGDNGSAVLNWLLEGIQDWLNDPFWVAPAVQAATEEYREESNRLWVFLRDACEIKANAVVSVRILYEVYREWCQAKDEPFLSKKCLRAAHEGDGI